MNHDWAIQRLGELRKEYAAGEEQLRLLHDRQTQIQDSMLRIDGAIQVLEEMIRQSGIFQAVEPRDPISVN